MSDTIFLNTNFVTPEELMEKAREMFELAKEAKKQDKFVRIWMDRGDKVGFPYGQVYIDRWTKADRWKWIKGRKVEADARKARKADAANESTSGSADVDLGVEDGGQIELPLETI